ncbi:DUF2711 family protein [bacterium]|nr:DUF2711 family protein [bacterium]
MSPLPEIPEKFRLSRTISRRSPAGIMEDVGEEFYDFRTKYPSYDTSILEHFKGVYDSVYVALHPFISIKKLGTESLSIDYKTFRMLEKSSAKQLTWSEIGNACDISDIKDMNRALLTLSLALNEKANDKSQNPERLKNYCAKQEFFLPTQGSFPASFENKILDLLLQFDITEACFGDEHDFNCELISLSEISRNKPWVSERSALKFLPQKVFTTDYQLLIIVDWDSVFSLVCTNLDASKKGLIEEMFEGFWCDEKTEHAWFV